jgi:hypothetical protein
VGQGCLQLAVASTLTFHPWCKSKVSLPVNDINKMTSSRARP